MADAREYRGNGRKMTLMVVLTKECETENCQAEIMSRAAAEGLLRFLYFRIYAGTQEIPNKKRDDYLKHLTKIHRRVVSSLGDTVELES